MKELKMSEKPWTVTYRNREGETNSATVFCSEKPSPDKAALLIRERLLGENFLLVDMPRDVKEPTLFLLNSYGYQIVGIEESTEAD
jgi:hypothetical protein